MILEEAERHGLWNHRLRAKGLHGGARFERKNHPERESTNDNEGTRTPADFKDLPDDFSDLEGWPKRLPDRPETK
jgi:hypothetical protein